MLAFVLMHGASRHAKGDPPDNFAEAARIHQPQQSVGLHVASGS